MEKKINIEGFREVTIKEIKFIDFVDTNGKEAPKMDRILKLGSDLTDDEIKNLLVKNGLIIIKEINEINGFTEDFQKL